MMDAHRQQRRRDAPQWDVFLSYIRRDGRRVAERIEEGLEQRGLSVWRYDNRLSVGDDVSARIEEALADSAYVVAVVSPMYARRPPRAVWTPGGEPGGPRMGILPVLHRIRRAYAAYRIPALAGTFMKRWDYRDPDPLLDTIARIAGGTGGPGGDPGHLDESLLSRDESDVLEFKSWPGSRPGAALESDKMGEKIARELCSFANTRGGDLLIGVGDDGGAEGLAPGGGRLSRRDRDRMLAWMANVVAEYIGAEHRACFEFEIVEVDGTDILHCSVAESADGPVILRRRLEGKHDFFVRTGSTCRALDSSAMLEYVEARWPERGGRLSRGSRRTHRGRSAKTAKGISSYTHPKSRRSSSGTSDADGAVDAEAGPAAGSGGIDVFLSYSHKVKDSVAEPLVRGLEKRGVSVWWDSTAMRISDTMDQKIREGIAGARHGVVIVSRDYLDSGWGQTELGGMFYRELQIFPILYKISAEDAQKKLPAIRGRIMRAWDDSPESIMDEIASVVKGDSRGPAARGSENAPAAREAASRAYGARREG